MLLLNILVLGLFWQGTRVVEIISPRDLFGPHFEELGPTNRSGMGKNDGVLDIVDPREAKVRSPFPLHVQFGDQVRAVALETVTVTAHKWSLGKYWGRVDVTERVRQGITPKGIVLPSVAVPPGKYKLTIRFTANRGQAFKSDVEIQVLP